MHTHRPFLVTTLHTGTRLRHPWQALVLGLMLLLGSCRTLQKNVLFTIEEDLRPEAFEYQGDAPPRNYRIAVNDYLAISVFTDKGEVLIDPNNEYDPDNAALLGQQQQGQQQLQAQAQNPNFIPDSRPLQRNGSRPQSFLVDQQGQVILPQVGPVTLAGLTLREADSLLALSFQTYYEKPYVVTQYLNKRVVVIGGVGDQVIPLQHEGMTLLEVLAMSRNLQENGRADRIRIIRGGLNQPAVKIVDLSSIKGLADSYIILRPGDVVYVEPRRRLDNTVLRDAGSILTIFTSLVTTYLLVDNLTNR